MEMKKLVLLFLIAAAGWYYFIAARKLDEAKIRAYYEQQTIGTLSREPTALCDLMADDFRGVNRLVVGSRRQEGDVGQEESCEEIKRMYSNIEAVGNRMGGIAQLDYSQEIDNIEISSDGKTATVTTTFSLDIAGQHMRLRGTNTDTLIRRNGRVLAIRTEGRTRVL
jgi:hypothetical protein